MNAHVRSARRARRIAIDAALAGALAILTAGVVHDVGHQVAAIHHRRLDVQTFWRWATPRGGHRAYAGARVVFNGRTTDELCTRRTGDRGRLCLTIRRSGNGARVLAVRRSRP